MRTIYDISVLGMGHYANRARTGIARVVENVALALRRNGTCEMEFCAYSQPEVFIKSQRFLRSRPDLRDVRLIHPAGRLSSAVARSIGHVYPDPSPRLTSRIRRRGCVLLMKMIDARSWTIARDHLQRSDIFHATFYPIPDFVRSFPSLNAFITVYDLIPLLHPQFFSFKEDHLLRDVMKCITPDDRVIAISHSTKNDLCDYLKFDPDRVFVTHLAASDLFRPCTDRDVMQQAREKYGIPEAPYILSLSTLEPRKNIDHTIRCFARLVREQGIRDLNLVLVGTKGWDFDRIFNELTKQDGLENRIFVTGYVSDEDLAAIYSGAQMFVYPSFYEGFGLPPLEAMQCGVPVITSNTSSLPEVVGDAGIMVDPQDADALCQSMLNVYRDSTLRSDLATKSLARAKQFSWDRCARETIEAYEIAVGANSSPNPRS